MVESSRKREGAGRPSERYWARARGLIELLVEKVLSPGLSTLCGLRAPRLRLLRLHLQRRIESVARRCVQRRALRAPGQEPEELGRRDKSHARRGSASCPLGLSCACNGAGVATCCYATLDRAASMELGSFAVSPCTLNAFTLVASALSLAP